MRCSIGAGQSLWCWSTKYFWRVKLRMMLMEKSPGWQLTLKRQEPPETLRKEQLRSVKQWVALGVGFRWWCAFLIVNSRVQGIMEATSFDYTVTGLFLSIRYTKLSSSWGSTSTLGFCIICISITSYAPSHIFLCPPYSIHCCSRPLDKRVNWQHFVSVVRE